MATARDWYELAKPRMVYGNLLTTVAAYLFATHGHVGAFAHPVQHAAGLVVGFALVVASGCVFNNVIDRHIDAKMTRTKERALAAGRVGVAPALLYGAVLGLVGLALLVLTVNALSAGIALFGWLMYVFVYAWAKRAGWWGALVGSIPGAIPITIGYTAASGRLDLAALLLFLILVAWQLPHFYAIALYRAAEYAEAGIPVLPAALGRRAAKGHIFVFAAVFLVLTLLLTLFHYAGFTYLVVVFALGAAWLWRALAGFRITEAGAEAAWARECFLFSLIVLCGFSLILALSPLLP